MVKGIITLLIVVVVGINGECPRMDEIPVMYNSDAFSCFKYWGGVGGQYDVDSCNGDSWLLPDNYDRDAGDGYHYDMGSIFVKPGCKLYMWNDGGYSGASKVIEGPAEIFNNDWGHHGVNSDWPRGPTGYKCRCIQDPVNCIPDDGYEVIIQCDNLNGAATTKCSYEHTVGTAFSDEVSEGMSVDETVEYAMEAQFWEIFKESMGISISTGYDWGHVSSETRSDQVTITLEAEAPPGLVLVIEQAVGHCDGSEARTEMFRTSHHDRQGNVVFQEEWKYKREPQSVRSSKLD